MNFRRCSFPNVDMAAGPGARHFFPWAVSCFFNGKNRSLPSQHSRAQHAPLSAISISPQVLSLISLLSAAWRDFGLPSRTIQVDQDVYR